MEVRHGLLATAALCVQVEVPILEGWGLCERAHIRISVR